MGTKPQEAQLTRQCAQFNRWCARAGAQEYRHKGVVNKSDQFAFPIATFYLDSEKVNGFLYNSKRNYQQLLFNRSVVDIFLLPKGGTFHEHLKTSISLFYLIANMSIYNLTENCEFNPIEIGDMLFYHKMIAGSVILLRERELPEDIVINGVSSVFHNPNAPLESLLNRYIAYGDESLSSFRDRYDEERI